MERLGLLLGEQALLDQAAGVDGAHRLVLADGPIEQRLGERRLVGFVVAQPPIAVEIDEHVAREAPPEVHRQLHRAIHGVGVVAVDVEDGRVDHLGDVGGVLARAALLRRGGEADLVVDHHVERAADAKRRQLAQHQRLLDHAFAGQRRVAVDEERQPALAAQVTDAVLLRAHAADRDRVDELEMAGIEAEREMDALAGGGDPVGGVPEVIAHVAATAIAARLAVLELAEDLARRLAEDVRQHVEPPAVRHADHDLGRALAAGLLHRPIEQRDQALGAFEREAGGPQILPAQERLERLGIGQPTQHAQSARRVGRPVVVAFHLRRHPIAGGGVADVHELDADRAAVDPPQPLDHLANGAPVAATGADHDGVELGRRDAVAQRIELGRERPLAPERIEPRGAMAVHAVLPDQSIDPVLERRGRFIGSDARARRAVVALAESRRRGRAEARTAGRVGPRFRRRRLRGVRSTTDTRASRWAPRSGRCANWASIPSRNAALSRLSSGLRGGFTRTLPLKGNRRWWRPAPIMEAASPSWYGCCTLHRGR